MSEAIKNSSAPSDVTDIRERATEFLQRRRYWNWSDENQAELDAWLEESPVHRVAFLRQEAGLARVERLAALRPIQASRARIWVSSMAVKIAAGVFAIAALGIGAALYIFQPQEKTYATAIGRYEIVALKDGSKIELNTDTVVRADVNANRRMAVVDKGEAYFQITHDENNPFIVTANGHRITVLGTKFSVRADADRTEVALFEGRVWFGAGIGHSPAQATLLTPGDVAIATTHAISVTKETVLNLSRELGWRRGHLIFGNTTLADAAAEFNRYNLQKIVIADSKTAQLRVGGTFQANHVEDFTHLVQAVLGLRVDRRGGETVISR
jgi:transmembrane sensor